MSVLGGVIAGGLTGGAVVWAVRILGTLGFGKEAMGLGDVHLMIAVGAVGGWSVVVLGFFLAAFIGVAHTTLTVGMGPLLKFRRQPIPFGPHLAAASIIVLIWREPLNAYFGMLLGG